MKSGDTPRTGGARNVPEDAMNSGSLADCRTVRSALEAHREEREAVCGQLKTLLTTLDSELSAPLWVKALTAK